MTSAYETGRFAEVSNLNLIKDRADAAGLVEEMLEDLREHPDEWENPTLERFLEALAASLEALPRVYLHRDEPFPTQPTWKLFAEALVMASGYE